MDQSRLKETLNLAGIKDYQYFESIGSTNDEALAWIDTNSTEFSLVIADEQTRGKGRFNRRWLTKPGSSLAFSLILKPEPSELSRIALFAPLCGLAIHDAFKSLYSLESEIKWPNDILLEGKKCCGILVETPWVADQANGIVLGIGINLAAGSLPPPNSQLFSATCIEDVLEKKVDQFSVLLSVLQQIQKWRPFLGTPQFFNDWESHLAFKGEQVMIVQSEKQSIIGIEKGIDQNGNLVLILENNQEMIFEVGDLHLRPTVISTSHGGKHA